MKFKSLFIAVLSIAFLTQCKEEVIVNEEEILDQEELIEEQEIPDCKVIDKLFGGFGQILFPPTYPLNSKPYFNPNNSDEIMFVHLDINNYPDMELIKYNLKTEEHQVLLDGYITSKLRWGKNGWILFALQEGQTYNIYKMRGNGEDLTKLSSYPYCFSPMWDMESKKVIYTLGYTSPAKSLLVDTDGQVLDTLFAGGGSQVSWQHPRYMAASIQNRLSIYDPYDATEYDPELINGMSEILYEPEYDGMGGCQDGAEWLDEERIIWCHISGVYITNIVTKETLKIRENCNSDLLQLPTYAPDINKVIFEHIQRIEEPEGAGSGYQTSSFYMMSPDGTGGETIEVVLE